LLLFQNIHFIKRFDISTIPVDDIMNKEGSFEVKVNEEIFNVPKTVKREEYYEFDNEISSDIPFNFTNNSFLIIIDLSSIILSNTFIHHPPFPLIKPME